MSTDTGHKFSFNTPRRLQKQLFSITGASSKRNLFQAENIVKQNDALSGEESDLGPMSPLDVTDNSSNESSPGQEYNSPFTTPEKSPTILGLTWDRLRPISSSQKFSRLSPFSSLKKLTRDARSSPRRKIFPNSLRESSNSPCEKKVDDHVPVSPTQTELESFMNDDIVPETPQKDYISDTPQKENFSERKLITPLGSVCKEIVIPPLHRRKSICPSDSSEESSPERRSNSIKRYGNDLSNISGTKLMKTDDGYSNSRARASLFQDEENDAPKFSALSTKLFYNQTIEEKRHSFSFGWRPLKTVKNKRQSLPWNSNHRRSTGSTKKQKFGEINAGVRHGIKRPRIKKKRHPTTAPPQSNNQSISETKENFLADNNITLPVIIPPPTLHPPLPRSASPISDPNKRFFKTNRTIQSRHAATITVNENIKLKVADGKFALQRKKEPICHVNKKPKLDNVLFDASDLTVEDPSFDASLNQNDVAGILKVLEDDWADDEYDTLKPLTAQFNSQSPSKSAKITNDMLLSPASVLSTMTSSMNIEDQKCLKNIEANTTSSELNQTSNATPRKIFPLFMKGYTSKMIENLDGKRSRGVKRPAAWQLSVKTNGGSGQYQLDAGQTRFGTIQCNECNVVYQIGEPEDENAHLIFHNSFKSLKFNGWKNERVVYQDPFTSNRVITIEASDPKHHWRKVEEVLAVVDKDLGLTDMKLSDFHNKKIYFYVKDKSIIGVLVAESITIAHRMIPEFFELNCCSEESTPVKCGVNVIWTALNHRRKGIARKLLDILRSSYFYGYIMALDDIAFSIPTPSGKIFAEKYTGSKNFKVYGDTNDTSN